ncbi:adenylate cyclase [Streptomyces sp. SID13031]|uniref:adenylate cyclase n=1 Tax=Streptomyces sp. SID13031 TaxID=2706046 RepID=UPI0013C7F223|nr:adenylate cyclase [Streptomyces sp. SID13031]NEA32672.1 adenylate cyclase [Streptomyces sp. SID13031]
MPSPQLLRELVGAADSVELKFCLADDQIRRASTALRIDLRSARPRRIFYLDTPDLALSRAGLIVRVRRIHRFKDDAVIKLRPAAPRQLDADLRRQKGFKVDVDVMPDRFVCSASLKSRPTAGAIAQAIAGRLPWSDLFTAEQRQFFSTHAPAGLALDDLTVLGPVLALKERHNMPGLPYPLTVDLWTYPTGSRLLEISTRVPPHAAFAAMADWRDFLERHRLLPGGSEVTKTLATLQAFSKSPARAVPRSSYVSLRPATGH